MIARESGLPPSVISDTWAVDELLNSMVLRLKQDEEQLLEKAMFTDSKATNQVKQGIRKRKQSWQQGYFQQEEIDGMSVQPMTRKPEFEVIDDATAEQLFGHD